MSSRRKLRLTILVVIAIIFSFIIADSMGVFHRGEYLAIGHGDHVHYVPKDRDPDVPVSAFPTRAPGPNERITPQGRIVPRMPQETE